MWNKKNSDRHHLCYAHLVNILNVLTCVSRLQGHSSIAWLQHPIPNKPSSLWAACCSQCELPNGYNGGQDHLLLLAGWGMYTATIKEKNILVLVKGSNVTLGVMDAGGMSLAGLWEYLIIWGRWGIRHWGKLEKGARMSGKRKTWGRKRLER